MAQGDTTRPRSVTAEFDPDFAATAVGGGVLIERTMRRLGLQNKISKHLPKRSKQAKYKTTDGVGALVAALLLGGRGIGAAQCLRQDELAREVFGLANGAPADSTMYRILCNLAGLKERPAKDFYEPAGQRLDSIDMFGDDRKKPAWRRIVPEEPEAATPENLVQLNRFVAAVAKRCHNALPVKCSRLHGYYAVFGDATDLEVDGRCFDAARKNHKGQYALRWLTLMLGPMLVAQNLMEGNRDEGCNMPSLLGDASKTVREMVGRRGKVLGLFDGAYFERDVISQVRSFGWDFIVCANQQRDTLKKIAEGQSEHIWTSTGPDSHRKWSESQVGCFTHLVGGWAKPVTIVARRYLFEDDMSGCWHYSFVATSIEPEDIPASLGKTAGYCSAIWMLYGTKQGRENHYKTSLCDLGLHHPPSCRLGINQAFYAIASAASNIAMVLRYAVVRPPERGIALWRLRCLYVRIAGYLVRSGHRLTVRLAGASTEAFRQVLWEKAYAAADRL
jgi:hypothetical protein